MTDPCEWLERNVVQRRNDGVQGRERQTVLDVISACARDRHDDVAERRVCPCVRQDPRRAQDCRDADDVNQDVDFVRVVSSLRATLRAVSKRVTRLDRCTALHCTALQSFAYVHKS